MEERRACSLTDKDVARIRAILNDELQKAREQGILLNEDERRFVREWIAATTKRRDFFEDVIKKTVVWAVLGGVAAIGLALWEAFKTKVSS